MSPDRRRVLAALLAATAAPAAWATDRLAPFRRGVSIHHILNWGQADEGKTGYRWPPFDTPQHRLVPETIDNLKRSGFDFIRLTIDSGVFLAQTGARQEQLIARVVQQVKDFIAKGFGVVVDFHGNSQIAAYDPAKITADSSSALFANYQALLVRMATALAPLTKERVAFELMNEPQWGWDAATTARWQAQQKQWHDAVRQVAPDLTLVLTGARGGSLDGLLAIDPAPFKGSKVLWSFHYYEPMLLTHQGVKADYKESRLWRYFSDLPYPAAPELFDPVWQVISANIRADRTLSSGDRARILEEAEKALRAYLDLNPGRSRVAADFARLDAWAKRNDIPADRLFMGEFGITRTYGPYKASPPGPLGNWLGDVRQEAEKRNIGWALWALSGYGGMSLIEKDDGPRFDPATLKALGMKE
jgi:hypothetical protein